MLQVPEPVNYQRDRSLAVLCLLGFPYGVASVSAATGVSRPTVRKIFYHRGRRQITLDTALRSFTTLVQAYRSRAARLKPIERRYLKWFLKDFVRHVPSQINPLRERAGHNYNAGEYTKAQRVQVFNVMRQEVSSLD